jgi:cellulose synthase/poly-beta-1,6-N-acetylglucosamine synthase-like glycosyltransferase
MRVTARHRVRRLHANTREVHMPKANSERPAVSVIVSAFDASRDVDDTLASVSAQTLADAEVIVVDGGSGGAPGAAWNAAIRASTCRYVAFLRAGDRWLPDFLTRQVGLLKSDRRCALVYCDARLSGDTPLAGQRFMEVAPSEGDVTLVSLIQRRCHIVPSTVVVRRRPLVAAGLVDETLRTGYDLELWLRLAWKGAHMTYQREVLAERRVRIASDPGAAVRTVERELNVLDRFGRDRALDAAARTALRVRMMTLVDRLEIEQGRQRFLEGNFAAAQYHLSASRERPLSVRLALLGLRLSPRLLRGAYLRFRPA